MENVTFVSNRTHQTLTVRTGLKIFESELPVQLLIGLGFILCVGVVSNFLTLGMLIKLKRWTSVNILIGLMSISDCFAIIVLFSVPIQAFYGIQEWTLCLQDTFTTSSCLCAVIISTERSFAIRNPLKFREIWTTRLTMVIYIIGLTIIFAIVLSRYVLTKDSADFFDAYVYLPYYIIMRGLPLAIILVMEILMITGLVQNRQRMKDKSSGDADRKRIKTESAITRAVIIMTTTYFVLLIPVRLITGLMRAGIFFNVNVYRFTSVIEMTNFSINVVIYTLTSKMFRREYIKYFSACICCLHKRENHGDVYVSNVASSNTIVTLESTLTEQNNI